MKEFTRDFVKENGMDIFVGGTNKANKYRIYFFNKLGFVGAKINGDEAPFARVRCITWKTHMADIAGTETYEYDFDDLYEQGWQRKPNNHHTSILVNPDDVPRRVDQAIEWLLDYEDEYIGLEDEEDSVEEEVNPAPYEPLYPDLLI
jgi:hypothetical protein